MNLDLGFYVIGAIKVIGLIQWVKRLVASTIKKEDIAGWITWLAVLLFSFAVGFVQFYADKDMIVGAINMGISILAISAAGYEIIYKQFLALLDKITAK